MTWRNDKYEHARVWNSAVGKVIRALDKHDLDLALFVFRDEFGNIISSPVCDEDSAQSMFIAWLVPSFNKNNTHLHEWYVREHPNALTPEEKEVLFEGVKSRFGVFRVRGQTDDHVKLVDLRGRGLLIETVSLPRLSVGSTLYARINSKGDGKYFFSGKFLLMDYYGKEFNDLSRVVRFQDTWSSYLVAFEKYLIAEEELTERTASKHESNIETFMLYLENTRVKSFTDITKTMLKTEFKNFARRNALERMDLDRAYYSLYKFFNYLAEAKKIHNEEALFWLRNRVF